MYVFLCFRLLSCEPNQYVRIQRKLSSPATSIQNIAVSVYYLYRGSYIRGYRATDTTDPEDMVEEKQSQRVAS